jgi:serine/threonine protein phosphatase 1
MKIQRLPVNDKGTDYFVGDIHGEYHKLMSQLNLIGFKEDVDRLISTGDLINRGEENLESLGLIHKPWFFCVKGNHEEMMINSLITKYPSDFENEYVDEFWRNCGGEWAFDLSSDMMALLKKDALLVSELPNIIQVGDIGVVHAECNSDDWNSFLLFHHDKMDTSLWGGLRKRHKDTSKVKNIRAIVVGHAPTKDHQALVLGNHIYIDSGAVFNNCPLIIKSTSEILSMIK